MYRRLLPALLPLVVSALGAFALPLESEAGKIRVIEADTLRVPEPPRVPRPPDPVRIIIETEDDSSRTSIVFNSSRWRRSDGEASSMVRFGEDVVVEEDEIIDGSAVAIGADVYVRGHVTEDVVAIGGKVVLEAGAMVEGDAVAIGGSVTTDPEARILGDDVGLRFLPTEVLGPFSTGRGFDIWALFAAGILVFLLMCGLLLEWVMPGRMRGVVEQIRLRLWPSFFAGLAAQVLFAPVLLLLVVTVIGIPVAVLLPFAAMLVQIAGVVAIAVLLGSRFFGGTFAERGEWARALVVGLGWIFGVAILALLVTSLGGAAGTIGGLLVLSVLAAHWTITTIGAGAVLLGRFGSRIPTEPRGGTPPPIVPEEDPFANPPGSGRFPTGGAPQGV